MIGVDQPWATGKITSAVAVAAVGVVLARAAGKHWLAGTVVATRFTDRARKALALAREEARLLDHPFVGSEHILLGLIREGDGAAAKALESLGISIESVREKVVEASTPSQR
jgi:hypothetical protein